MHGAPPLGRILRRDCVDLVDRGLGRLELSPVVDDGAGLVQSLPELSGPLVDGGRRIDPARRLSADQPPQRGETDREPTGQEREAAVHGADATLLAASCLASRCPRAPTPARPPRPKEGEFGTVTPYEILLMLDPELPDERQSEIVQRTRELIEQGGGNWEALDVWGRRKLSYEIDKKADGAYHLLTFQAEPETLDEVSRVLKITDGVMRHMAVRRSERRPAETVAASAPTRQDEAEPAAAVQEEEE